MNRVKKPLIILTGPTAVGKTSLSIALAKAVNGEIISADSMQVYRHMDIGSAKIRPEEMQGVPHHLVDCLEPDEEFNVVRFQQMAKEAMKGIYDRGRIPVLVGGTGFYIQAVTGDMISLCMERIRLIGRCWKKKQRLRERRRFMRCLLLWILHLRRRFMQTM